MPRGRLYLVPSLLGATAPADVLPQRTIDVARALGHYVVENAKPARQFLKALGPARGLQAISMVEIGSSPSRERCAELLAPALAGEPLGVLSDAGCPGVADPGAALVEAAHAAGIVVVPLVGPSSLLLALMGSGMNGQGFVFHGYLPVPPQARGAALRRLEAASARDGQAQLFIETPYRNEAMLGAVVAHCRMATRLCVAVDLTTATESIESRAVGDWRGRDFARYAKRPAIFILQAR
jgi:16S rRNA (cytidine1402-2'-O)-methyltransferase